MKIVLDKWAVAYRKTQEDLLDVKESFIPIPNNYKCFYADPFVFSYQGEDYLFVEYYSFRFGRGTIAYSKYNSISNTFGEFHEIIQEDYHLSYPLVFSYNNEIYLMPESYQSETLYIYKAIDFPDKWEKHAVLLENVKFVDTTPFIYNGEFYAVTKQNNTPDDPMLLLKIDSYTWRVTETKIVTTDKSISRPGGKVFQFNGQYYMVTQDCEKGYGTALNFLKFSINKTSNVSLDLVCRVTPEEIKIEGVSTVSGIHTFNTSNRLTVIDYKYPNFSLYRTFFRLVEKVKRKKH